MNISNNIVIDKEEHILFQVNGFEATTCKFKYGGYNEIESKINLLTTYEGLCLSDLTLWKLKPIV